jgi:tetratricopeptide (TPR) repeat protein
MRVAARTSAFEFKDRNIDVRRIGQSLGVRHVLEGSVRRDGNNVRVTVQLVDTRSGYHLWTSNFDRPWRDVLELQDDIARSVTEALEIVLTGHHVDLAPVPSSTFDSRAIDPYLAGLALLRKPSDASNLRQAEESFRQSLRFDPAFAGAHAGLCRALARAYDQSRDRAALTEAEAACRKALSLDASLIDTERALATLYVSSGDFQRATATYRALLERNPGDPDAHIGLGYALAGAGETAQAEASFRRAIAIEPSYWGAHSALASHLFKRGKNDEATLALRKATELAPTSASAWSNLGGALQMAGDVEGAAKAYQRSLELEPSKDAYSNLATLYFSAGRFGDAVRNFELALALGPHDQIIHGNLGDALWQVEGRREEAIATYHRAIELAEAELAATPGDPTLRAQLGFYYGRVGDRNRSISHLEHAVAAAPDLVYVQYYRAVAAADRDDRATALEAVRELVRLGYPQNVLRSAPEFRSLLRDPEYIKIVGSG